MFIFLFWMPLTAKVLVPTVQRFLFQEQLSSYSFFKWILFLNFCYYSYFSLGSIFDSHIFNLTLFGNGKWDFRFPACKLLVGYFLLSCNSVMQAAWVIRSIEGRVNMWSHGGLYRRCDGNVRNERCSSESVSDHAEGVRALFAYGVLDWGNYFKELKIGSNCSCVNDGITR